MYYCEPYFSQSYQFLSAFKEEIQKKTAKFLLSKLNYS